MAIELPELNTMFEMIDEIYSLSSKKALLEVKLKISESLISREAQTNPKYFKDGKAPSQTFVDNSYKYSGFADELIPVREEVGELESKITMLKSKLDLNEKIIDIWRTQAANERIVTG